MFIDDEINRRCYEKNIRHPALADTLKHRVAISFSVSSFGVKPNIGSSFWYSPAKA